jgi:hypothetical protein
MGLVRRPHLDQHGCPPKREKQASLEGTGEGRLDGLLCSRNARSRTPLVGRAQWETNLAHPQGRGLIEGRWIFHQYSLPTPFISPPQPNYHFQCSWKLGPSDLGFVCGSRIWMVKGIGKSAPIMAASPGLKFGRNADAERSISPHARSTTARS